MIGIVGERLRGRHDAGFVLDGFPRTVAQATALDGIMAAAGRWWCRHRRAGGRAAAAAGGAADLRRLRRQRADRVDLGVRQLRRRAGHRTDDGDGDRGERLKVYHRRRRPIVEFYSGRPTFRTIDGNQPPDVVTAAMDAAIARRRSRRRARRPAVIVCKSPAELEKMRAANQLVARILEELAAMVAPGVTTADLDAAAESRVRAAGAEPAFKGYRGYPATLCASVNEQVVHGIPSATPLSAGDIVSLDMGVKLNGYYGDSAVTVPVGTVDEERAHLLRVTREALDKGIAQVKVGGRISDIGHAIQAHVEAHGFSVVREFVGHGIGASLHEEPQIANYGEPGRGPRLAEGMTLAIEPMVNMGKAAVRVLADGLDGGDEGRQPVGALRAHGGRHEGRPAGA
jgi:methionyl aminopeptidase